MNVLYLRIVLPTLENSSPELLPSKQKQQIKEYLSVSTDNMSKINFLLKHYQLIAILLLLTNLFLALTVLN
ncbi:hypothetical protein GCM10023150_14290 [Kangiella taiwanensis]|uniref:Uncharacterized protein n=1 Tax=Kangiella taiwanensis TaxID=1079179 RepID=A0ABP8I240_9GAMM